MRRILATFLFLAIALPSSVLGQATAPAGSRVESNVVYGMYSGLALLMDVHYPQKPNGYGIIYIGGSGWYAPMSYDAKPLKDHGPSFTYGNPLLDAGYTLFVINHRSAPRFRYPAAVEDAQRAVRYIRHYAAKYGMRADRIGAVGASSGGHLVSLLGVLDGEGDPQDADPVNRESARVQCVVAFYPATDFINGQPRAQEYNPDGPGLLGFIGMERPSEGASPTSVEYKTYREASPIYHVSADDAPHLLIHGTTDIVVPIKHSELMERG